MRTNELTKAGLIAAFIVLFALVFIYFPLFSFFGMFLGVCTVAVLVVSVASPKAIGIALAVSMLLTALFSDVLTMLYSGVLMIVLPGLATGICFRKKARFFTLLMTSALAYLAAIMIMFVLMKLLFQIDFVAEFKGMMEEALRQMTAVVESVPELSDQQGASALLQGLPQLLDTMTLMLPAAFLMTAGLLALGSIMLSGGVLRRMGLGVAHLPSFSYLIAPKQLSYCYLLLTLIGMLSNNTTIYFLLNNVTTILSMILFVCGSSLLKYGINKTGAPKGVCLLLFCMAMSFLLLLYQFVVFVGIADTLWDFRKLRGPIAR